MRAWIPVALLLAAMAAGCTDGSGSTPPEAGTGAPSSGPPGPPGPATTPAAAPQGEPAQPVTLYIHADGSLSEAPPAAGSIPMPGGTSYFATGQVGMGKSFLLELTSAPVEQPALVVPDNVTATLWLGSASTAASLQVFDAAAWFGTSRAVGLFGFDTKGGLIPPGGMVEHQVTLSRPDAAAIYLPAQGNFRLLVGAGYTYEEAAGNLELLVGPDNPSRIEFSLRPLGSPADGGDIVAQDQFSGTLQGRNPFLCGQEEGVDVLRHEVVVHPDATWLLLESSGADGQDLDLDLYDGTLWLGGGHTPSDKETIALTGQDVEPLRGRSLDLEVSGCLGGGGATIPYTVEMTQRGV